MGSIAVVTPQFSQSLPRLVSVSSSQRKLPPVGVRSVVLSKQNLKINYLRTGLTPRETPWQTMVVHCACNWDAGVVDGISTFRRKGDSSSNGMALPRSCSRKHIIRGARAGRDASTADESRAANGFPSLEEMLIPPTNFATTSESRLFTIMVHGVTSENDVRRLYAELKHVDGLLNAWIGPLTEGGLRGGSVTVQIEVESGVPLRNVTKSIQSLDKNLLVLPFKTNSWLWRGNKINYATAGCGKPIILVHGFGGNVGHFASLISYLAEDYRVYAVDLLGFGASDKPTDGDYGPDLWGELLKDFTKEFADGCAVLVGNSIGSLAVLSAAAMLDDDAVSGIVLLNCAGAMNRKGLQKDDLLLRALSPIFIAVEFLLRIPRVANYLFNGFRKKKNVKTILSQQAYINKDSVTDELVDILHLPSDDPGALEVFVKVFTNEPGPRPETLMPHVNAPVLLLWGDKDRWTPPNGKVANYFRRLGEERGNVSVEILPNVGHCPHDDRPELAAARISTFLDTLNT